MKFRIFLTIISILLITTIVCADFVASDKPSFDVSTNGNRDHQNYTFTGTIPVKKLNGYVGVQWIHTRDSDAQTSDHIKSRAEGGYHYGKFGITRLCSIRT